MFKNGRISGQPEPDIRYIASQFPVGFFHYLTNSVKALQRSIPFYIYPGLLKERASQSTDLILFTSTRTQTRTVIGARNFAASCSPVLLSGVSE